MCKVDSDTQKSNPDPAIQAALAALGLTDLKLPHVAVQQQEEVKEEEDNSAMPGKASQVCSQTSPLWKHHGSLYNARRASIANQRADTMRKWGF